jgi:hypothetical protein
MATEPLKIKVGEHHVTLAPIESPSIRWDLATASQENYHRALTAALGLAWNGPGAPSAKLSRCKFDMLVYGGQVFNELIRRGVTGPNIVAFGAVAWASCVNLDDLITDDEVKDEKDFSEGEEDTTD